MDVQALTAFVAVAREGSFSAAAEKLFLTQPAVSKRIAALESELDSRLFDRLGRQVQLTEAGAALLRGAERVLNDLEETKRQVRDLSGDVAGQLIMGTSHHIGLHRLPPVLRHFTHEYPDVQLDIRFMDSEDACRAVHDGELQLAIVTLPPQGRMPGVILESLWDDPLCFATSPDHPLSALAAPTLEDLTDYAAVLPSPATYTREVLEQAMRERNLTPRIGMSTNYLETLRMLVSIGLGWSLLPETMLDESVVALPIAGVEPRRQLGAVIHAQRTLSNAAQAMLRTCRDVAGAAGEHHVN